MFAFVLGGPVGIGYGIVVFGAPTIRTCFYKGGMAEGDYTPQLLVALEVRRGTLSVLVSSLSAVVAGMVSCKFSRMFAWPCDIEVRDWGPAMPSVTRGLRVDA